MNCALKHYRYVYIEIIHYPMYKFCGLISQSHLQVLNVTGLRLSSLVPFQKLYRLEELQAAENAFTDAHQLGQQLGAFGNLHKVNLTGCPVAQRDLHYKELMLEQTPHLIELDDQHIPKSRRSFMRDFARKRSQRSSLNACSSNATAPPEVYQSSAAGAVSSWPGVTSADAQRKTQSDIGPVRGLCTSELVFGDNFAIPHPDDGKEC